MYEATGSLRRGIVMISLKILATELRRLLTSDDDDSVASTLDRWFRPQPRFSAPFFYDWVPLPDLDVVIGDEDDGGPYELAARRIIDLANAADAALRARRFAQRRRQHPEWPVVLCEGDSWIAHPLVHDIGDHLFDDPRNRFAVRNCGAAGDRLTAMAAAREHEGLLLEHDAVALVLSGGGNDLLVQFREFLRTWEPGDAPARLVHDVLEPRLTELMVTMRQVLRGARDRDRTLPIIVHGYDYLRVAAPERGQFLSPWFDAAKIVEARERQATLDYIVDRFNHHLRDATLDVEGVAYVDVRGRVGEDQWFDEIHPNDDGFARVAEAIGEVLRDRVARR
jgi:lysophospholipase L1-like esterase